ncbi:hypothetical protein N752_18015 [Desulforamulus aquiferis]|nr:hypothetical protein N752_18015 [Desulforamulus aquiferis]
MAETLLRAYRNRISSFELIPSSGGVFEVRLNGELIYSKKEIGRFPEKMDIINKLSI